MPAASAGAYRPVFTGAEVGGGVGHMVGAVGGGEAVGDEGAEVGETVGVIDSGVGGI